MQTTSTKWFHVGLAGCLALVSCDNKQNNAKSSTTNNAADQAPASGDTTQKSDAAPQQNATQAGAEQQPAAPEVKKVQASLEERVQAYGALAYVPADASMAFRLNYSEHMLKKSLFTRIEKELQQNLEEQDPADIAPEMDGQEVAPVQVDINPDALDGPEPPQQEPEETEEQEEQIDKTTGEEAGEQTPAEMQDSASDAEEQAKGVVVRPAQAIEQEEEETEDERDVFPFKQVVVSVGKQPEQLANMQEVIQQQVWHTTAAEVFAEIVASKQKDDDYMQKYRQRSMFTRSIPLKKLALLQQSQVPQLGLIFELQQRHVEDASGFLDSVLNEITGELGASVTDHKINDIAGKLVELDLENIFMTDKERRAKLKQNQAQDPAEPAVEDEEEQPEGDTQRFMEEEGEYVGNMKLSEMREQLKGKKLFVWIGGKDNYKFLLTAPDKQQLQLAATPADSLVATEEIGSNDANIKKDQTQIKDLLEVMSYTFSHDESIEILGDTRPVLDMFKQLGVVWEKYANQFEAGPADIFVSANDEQLSINLTPYWIDNKGDWKKPLQFTKLKGADTAAIVAMHCNKELRRSYSELLATSFETFYTISSSIGKSKAAESFSDLVGMQQFIDKNMKQNGIASWQNVNNILLDGIGAETAMVIDMQGKMPNFPGIGKEYKQLPFPRFALVNDIDNRKSISDNWDSLQNNLNSIYKNLPQDVLDGFNLQKDKLPAEIPAVTRTETNGYANYFYQFPLLDNNFTPNLSLNDRHLLITSNFAFSDEIKQTLATSANSEARCGLYMHVNLQKIASAYTPQQAATAANNMDRKAYFKELRKLGIGMETSLGLLHGMTLSRIVPEMELVSSVDANNSIKLSLNIKTTPPEPAKPKKTKKAAADKQEQPEPRDEEQPQQPQLEATPQSVN